MINIRNLSKRYGSVFAIKNLNFSVAKGEVVGFLGPNGAGKTTTMKILTGYMAPTEGEVSVGEYDVFENPLEVKRKIGYLPETPPLYADMRVRDYLNYVGQLKGLKGPGLTQNVQRVIEQVNLSDVQKRLINNLSKGYKQRVGIAQALVSNPEILVLDEPTIGLDPKQVSEIRTLINQLKGQHTVILSTHILSEVQAICEKIIIINKGNIVAEDTLAGLNKRLSGASRVFVRVKRAQQDLLKNLAQVQGVAHVGEFDASGGFHVELADTEGAREELARQVVQSGTGLLEFRSMDMSLEDIFLKVTE